MNEYTYAVTISNEGNVIKGNLREANHCGPQIEFNPLTVLGDLLNIVTYEEASAYPQDNYSFKEDFTNHPFFFGLQGKMMFSSPLYSKHFFVVLNELKEIITANKRLSMSQFEILKQFLSLKFTYTIFFREEDPLYGNKFSENQFDNKSAQEYQYIPLNYNYNLDMKLLFMENNSIPHKFVYNCYSTEDVVFSVLHYLVFLKYKFNKCNHCDNYFATKTKKEIYCNRNSPYKGREDLICGEAVDRILTKVMKRRNTIKANLYKFYNQEVAKEFLKEFKTYKRVVKSVKNLQMLERITSKNYAKEKWYKEEYKNEISE